MWLINQRPFPPQYLVNKSSCAFFSGAVIALSLFFDILMSRLDTVSDSICRRQCLVCSTDRADRAEKRQGISNLEPGQQKDQSTVWYVHRGAQGTETTIAQRNFEQAHSSHSSSSSKSKPATVAATTRRDPKETHSLSMRRYTYKATHHQLFPHV